METVIEKIEEIQSMLEREVEWPLTDGDSADIVKEYVSTANIVLERLKNIAESS